MKIPLEVSIHLKYLHQDLGLGIASIQKKYPQYPKTTLYRHMKAPITKEEKKKPKKKLGRPKKLSERDERKIIREVHLQRKKVGACPSTDIQKMAGVNKVSNRTVRRTLHQHGYGYRQCRKKGQLTKEDLKKRLNFARKCKRLPSNFWTDGISFYLDGASWVHKTNPHKNAKTQRTRMWRRKDEGLERECTAKGKKEGVCGKVAKFMVAIAYGKGVIECHRYEGQLNGELFSQYIKDNFSKIFQRGNNRKGCLFLQDGDPSQNSALSKEAMDSVNCRLFNIPARSPDLNPIENLFNSVRDKLRKDALDRMLEKETFEQFCRRVKNTMLNFPVNQIDKTIASMPKRIDMVIEKSFSVSILFALNTLSTKRKGVQCKKYRDRKRFLLWKE